MPDATGPRNPAANSGSLPRLSAKTQVYAPKPTEGQHVYIYDGRGQKHLATVMEVLPKSYPVRVHLKDETETEVIAAYHPGGAAGTWQEVE